MILIDVVKLVLFPAAMAFAAFSDLFTMTISNRLSLVVVAGFFVLALATGMSWGDIGTHVGASAAVLAVSFFLFSQGWIGGGDAKLAAAIALWFGFDQLLTYLIYASLFGGLLTFLILRFRFLPLPRMLAGLPWAERLHRMDTGVPYGIALAAAALLVYPNTAFMAVPGM